MTMSDWKPNISLIPPPKRLRMIDDSEDIGVYRKTTDSSENDIWLREVGNGSLIVVCEN